VGFVGVVGVVEEIQNSDILMKQYQTGEFIGQFLGGW